MLPALGQDTFLFKLQVHCILLWHVEQRLGARAGLVCLKYEPAVALSRFNLSSLIPDFFFSQRHLDLVNKTHTHTSDTMSCSLEAIVADTRLTSAGQLKLVVMEL